MNLPVLGKMDQSEVRRPKLKLVRVVTASYVVPWHLANTLNRASADFEVCVVGQDVSSCKNLYPDIRWVDIDLERKVSFFSDLRALLTLCRFFIAYKPDIVHSIMPKAGLLTAIAGLICLVPVRIHTFTGQVWATKKGVLRMFYYWLDRLINLLNTMCLTDSPSQSEFLRMHSISNAGRALPVLSKGSLSGVDVERFNLTELVGKSAHLQVQLGLNESDFVFTYIARKTSDKGAVDVLKAFSVVCKSYPNAKLLFVGPDESDGVIESLLKVDSQIFHNVLSVGEVKKHELYLAISDVLCLPSYREGFGTIVIDAAALGVPAIGSNIPGLIDSIEDGKTGRLFPVGNISALAGVMVDFLQNPDQLKRMGLQAKERIHKFFTADMLYEELRALYFKLATNQTGTKIRKNRHKL